MTREEFSLMLVEARQNKGISRYQINRFINKTDIQTARIEKASVNYSMTVLFPYINALNMSLIVYNQECQYIIKSSDTLSLILKKIRVEHCNQTQFALETGLSLFAIKCMETGRTSTTIDTLLLALKALHYKIKLIEND